MNENRCDKSPKEARPMRRGRAIALGGVLVSAPLIALYVPTFVALDHIWRIDPNYSHGWLVVAASLFFAYRAWRRAGPPWQTEVRPGELVLGEGLLALGLVLHFLASFLGMLLLDVVALILILRAGLLLLGGRQAVRNHGFACLFLIFMAPLPIVWYQPLANLMQRLVTSLSASVIGALGVPVFAEGYLLSVPGHSMEMAEACSGLRQLTAFLAVAVAVGHLTGRGFWFKAALAAFSGVVAVAANCVRVVATVLILVSAGPGWAEGVFHSVEGLMVVGLGLLMLVALAWGLSCLENRLKLRASAVRQNCIVGK